jgi:hypothetical protein
MSRLPCHAVLHNGGLDRDVLALVAAHAGQRVDLAKLVFNEHRPHQALGGLTPMQAWHGMNWADVGRANEARRERAGREVGERLRW